MNNSGNNQNNNSSGSKIGIIVTGIFLAVVIVLAVIIYNTNSDFDTGLADKTIEDIKEANKKAENAEKMSEQTEGEEIGGGSASENAESDSDTEAPMLAPDFTVLSGDKSEVKLSDKRGKPVIISFWATWCGACAAGMPAMENAYKQYGDKLELMMINPTDGINDTYESVSDYLEETGYTFPVYHDTTGLASYIYSANSIPVTYFVNEDGYLLGGYRGPIKEEDLNSIIAMLLEE